MNNEFDNRRLNSKQILKYYEYRKQKKVIKSKILLKMRITIKLSFLSNPCKYEVAANLNKNKKNNTK